MRLVVATYSILFLENTVMCGGKTAQEALAAMERTHHCAQRGSCPCPTDTSTTPFACAQSGHSAIMAGRPESILDNIMILSDSYKAHRRASTPPAVCAVTPGRPPHTDVPLAAIPTGHHHCVLVLRVAGRQVPRGDLLRAAVHHQALPYRPGARPSPAHCAVCVTHHKPSGPAPNRSSPRRRSTRRRR